MSRTRGSSVLLPRAHVVDERRSSTVGTAAVVGPVAFVAFVVFVVFVVLAAAVVGPWQPPLRSTAPKVPLPPRTMPPVTPSSPVVHRGRTWDPTALLHALVLLLFALALTAAAVGLTVLLARLLKMAAPWREPGDDLVDRDLVAESERRVDLPALRRGIGHAARHLREIGVPRDAVIAAWVALERAAEASGVPRSPAQTPTEFTLDVLGRTSADPMATRSLLGLYARARFGAEPVTVQDVAQAARCLASLAEALDLDPGGRADRAPAPAAGAVP